MSDEFIKQIGRQVRLYYSIVKPLSQKEIIANGFRHMNEEAFLAFNHYVAEKDLFEVCMTPIIIFPCSHYHYCFLSYFFLGF